MDVYGAFQLCALGALAAPVTVRLSSTYFYDNGRNLIFIWTLLVLAGKIQSEVRPRTAPDVYLAGLISLAVEFYRLDDIPCRAFEGQGNPADYTLATFPYGDATCGLTCSTEDGPFSAIRGGSVSSNPGWNAHACLATRFICSLTSNPSRLPTTDPTLTIP